MSKWKAAFLKSVHPDFNRPEDFQFGPPATDEELTALEAAVVATVPDDLRELLSEFNGVKEVRDGREDKYFYPTSEMTTAAEYYREWDWPTDLLLRCSENILYVCQENGYSEMWGIVIKPFSTFEYGQVVAFDHDQIAFAEEADELFNSPYGSLLELVEARYKSTGLE